MDGFILEVLLNGGWRKRNEIFWLLQDAQKEAKGQLRHGVAKAVKILAVKVALQPVLSFGIDLPQQEIPTPKPEAVVEEV